MSNTQTPARRGRGARHSDPGSGSSTHVPASTAPAAVVGQTATPAAAAVAENNQPPQLRQYYEEKKAKHERAVENGKKLTKLIAEKRARGELAKPKSKSKKAGKNTKKNAYDVERK